MDVSVDQNSNAGGVPTHPPPPTTNNILHHYGANADQHNNATRKSLSQSSALVSAFGGRNMYDTAFFEKSPIALLEDSSSPSSASGAAAIGSLQEEGGQRY